MASFNDSRCTTGAVCSTDSLLFTCELREVMLLRVVLPTGCGEHFTYGLTVANAVLPAGFTAESLEINEVYGSLRNISLTLSIANASLLDGGEIICDDTTERNRAKAGCPSTSMFRPHHYNTIILHHNSNIVDGHYGHSN